MSKAIRVYLSVAELGESFKDSMRAQNRRPTTIKTYLEAIDGLHRFLESNAMPTDAGKVRRDHVEAYITHMLENLSPGTASVRYRALKVFWRWCDEEGEASPSPMAKMHPPKVPEPIVPVLTRDELRALLKACEGRDFDARRDMAVLRMLIDTGMRRREMGSVRLEDIDRPYTLIRVPDGKGGRGRVCVYGRKAAQALDRYLRVRLRTRHADSEWLWIGHRGPMARDGSGVAQILVRRSRSAGLGRIYPHQLRHTWAHRNMAADIGETNVMMLAGWRSRTMLSRYARSTATERATEAARRLGLGDDI